MTYSKAQLRELALRARAELGQEARAAKSAAIAAHLAAWPEYMAARTVCLYASFGSEVQTGRLLEPVFLGDAAHRAVVSPVGGDPLSTPSNRPSTPSESLSAASEAQHVFCLPRVDGRQLVVHRIDSLAPVVKPAAKDGLAWPEALVRSPMGMLEPPASAPVVAPEQLDLIVVPGSAFSLGGGRLGYGKGFYDQLLPRAPQALKVGLCFDVQLFADEGFPLEAHDVALDALVSESGIMDLRRG